MVKGEVLCSIFFLIFTISLLNADFLQALQLDTAAYSASELTALMQAIFTLRETIDNYTIAMRRAFAPNALSSRDFAAYTAGIPAEIGYKTKLVSSPGWPDEGHPWATVGIQLHGKTVWVPVQAPSPRSGCGYHYLGSLILFILKEQ